MMPEAVLNYAPLVGNMLNGIEMQVQEFKPEAVSYADTSMVSPHQAKYLPIPKNSVGVINISGPIIKNGGACSYGTTDYIQQVKELEANKNIGAVLIIVDSPGGQADGIASLANAISAITKPNAAIIDGTGASAGYWIASAAQRTYATEATNVVGSIGAMMSFADVRPAMEKQGVKFHRVNADQSADKNEVFEQALSGNYTQLKEEILNPMAQSFIDAIKTNRPKVTAEQLTGRIYTAEKVVGTLLDGIKSLDQVVAELKSEINSSPKITTYYV
jgi:protease-4